MWESTEIIGRMQFEKAAELYEKANVVSRIAIKFTTKHTRILSEGFVVNAKCTACVWWC